VEVNVQQRTYNIIVQRSEGYSSLYRFIIFRKTFFLSAARFGRLRQQKSLSLHSHNIKNVVKKFTTTTKIFNYILENCVFIIIIIIVVIIFIIFCIVNENSCNN